MNTKGKRFLAVLAVLAFAFVAFAAVGADNSASIIEVNDGTTEQSAVPSIVYDTETDVVRYTTGTVIEAGKAYYISASAAAPDKDDKAKLSIIIPDDATKDKPVILFLQEGGKINVVPSSKVTGAVYFGIFSAVDCGLVDGKLVVELTTASTGLKYFSDYFQSDVIDEGKTTLDTKYMKPQYADFSFSITKNDKIGLAAVEDTGIVIDANKDYTVTYVDGTSVITKVTTYDEKGEASTSDIKPVVYSVTDGAATIDLPDTAGVKFGYDFTGWYATSIEASLNLGDCLPDKYTVTAYDDYTFYAGYEARALTVTITLKEAATVPVTVTFDGVNYSIAEKEKNVVIENVPAGVHDVAIYAEGFETIKKSVNFVPSKYDDHVANVASMNVPLSAVTDGKFEVDGKKYDTITKALEAAGDEKVIKLLADFAIVDDWAEPNVIDLNGYTLTLLKDATFTGTIYNGGVTVRVTGLVANEAGVQFSSGSVHLTGEITVAELQAIIDEGSEDGEFVLEDVIITEADALTVLKLNGDVTVKGDLVVGANIYVEVGNTLTVSDQSTISLTADSFMEVKEDANLSLMGASELEVQEDANLIIGGAVFTDEYAAIVSEGEIDIMETANIEEATINGAVTIWGGSIEGVFENDVTIIGDTVIIDDLYVSGNLYVVDAVNELLGVTVKVYPGVQITVQGTLDLGDYSVLYNAGSIYTQQVAKGVDAQILETPYAHLYIKTTEVTMITDPAVDSRGYEAAFLAVKGKGTVTIDAEVPDNGTAGPGVPEAGHSTFTNDSAVGFAYVFYDPAANGVLFTVDAYPVDELGVAFDGYALKSIRVYGTEVTEDDIDFNEIPVLTKVNNRYTYSFTLDDFRHSTANYMNVAFVEVEFQQTFAVKIYDENANKVGDDEVVLIGNDDITYNSATKIWTVPVGAEVMLLGMDNENYYYEFISFEAEIDDYDMFEMPENPVDVTVVKHDRYTIEVIYKDDLGDDFYYGSVLYGTSVGNITKTPVEGKIHTYIGQQLYFTMVSNNSEYYAYKINGADYNGAYYTTFITEDNPANGKLRLVYKEYEWLEIDVDYGALPNEEIYDDLVYYMVGDEKYYPVDGKFIIREGSTYTFGTKNVYGYELNPEMFSKGLTNIDGDEEQPIAPAGLTVRTGVDEDEAYIKVNYVACEDTIAVTNELVGANASAILTVTNLSIPEAAPIIIESGEEAVELFTSYAYEIRVSQEAHSVNSITYEIDDVEDTINSDTLAFAEGELAANNTLAITDIVTGVGKYRAALVDQKGGAVILGLTGEVPKGTVVRLNNIVPNEGYKFNESPDFVKFYKAKDATLKEKGEQVDIQLEYDAAVVGGWYFEMPAYDVILTIEFEQIVFFFDLPADGTVVGPVSYEKVKWLAGAKTFTFTITPPAGKELSAYWVTPTTEGVDYDDLEVTVNDNVMTIKVNKLTDVEIYTAYNKNVTTAIFTEQQEYIVTKNANGKYDMPEIWVYDQDGFPILDQNITMRSSNTGVVEFDKNGVGKIKGLGVATITVTYKGMTTTTMVKVYDGLLNINEIIQTKQELSDGLKINDNKDVTILKGGKLILNENASLDLNQRTLYVNGTLEIGKNANVFNGNIVLGKDAVIINNGSIGKDIAVEISYDIPEALGIVKIPGTVAIRDVSGIGIKPVVLDYLLEWDNEMYDGGQGEWPVLNDDFTYYAIEISGEALGYTPWSTIYQENFCIASDFSTSNITMYADMIYVDDGNTFYMDSESSLINALVVIGDEVEVYLMGNIDAAVLSLTGAVPRGEILGAQYYATVIFLINVQGAVIKTYEEPFVKAGVYFDKKIMDLSGSLKVGTLGDFMELFDDLYLVGIAAEDNASEYVGVTVSSGLMLEDFKYKTVEGYNFIVDDSVTLFVDGVFILYKDTVPPELENVDGAAFAMNRVSYIMPLEDVLDAIDSADNKTIYVYEDLSLKIDMPANSVINMMKEGLKVTVPASANITIGEKAAVNDVDQITVNGTVTVKKAAENQAFCAQLTGYHVVTEFDNGDVEYCSLKAALASGKTDITLAENAVLTDKTVIPAGVKLTIPAGKKLTVKNDFVLSEGAVIDDKGQLVFQGAEGKRINVGIAGDIDVAAANGFVATYSDITVTGSVNATKGNAIVEDDSNNYNGAYYEARVGKSWEYHYTNLDDAVAGANVYSTAKYPIAVEVQGKVTAGALELADYTSLNFKEADAKILSIDMAEGSNIVIDALSEVTTVVSGIYGSGVIFENETALVEAGNLMMSIGTARTNVTTYTTYFQSLGDVLPVMGEVTFVDGQVHVDAVAGKKFTIASDAMVIIDGDDALYVGNNSNTTVNGVLEISKNGKLEAQAMKVAGTLIVDKGAEVYVCGENKPFAVTGDVVIADGADFIVDGLMTVGTKKTSIAAAASVSGNVTILEDCYVTVYAGADVSAAWFNYDDLEMADGAVHTTFYVNDMEYMTVFANPGDIGIVDVVANEAWYFVGYDASDLDNVLSWSNASGTLVTLQAIGAAQFKSVFAEIDYLEVIGQVSVETGIQVFIDGKNLNTYIDTYTEGLRLTVMETHTIEILAENGYKIDKATITVDGALVTNGKFSLAADAESFLIVVSGAEIVTPSGGQGTDVSGIVDKLDEGNQTAEDAAAAAAAAAAAQQKALEDLKKQIEELEKAQKAGFDNLGEDIKDQTIDVEVKTEASTWNITTILLVILVILIAIMAIIVALRFNRS
jgi:hypothetical protein